ncbi:LysR family transcriptional regulator [Nocardia sp. NPDC020380]|uniref:LysR family transcriptional regulator n=1 Tax=Nocardia sp. NPDC020380 TaxID=3364309 RepID=UPI00379E8322
MRQDAPIDFGALRVFLTLSEELHFGRTAERLSLSQPRVSQLIREMERHIGGELFRRTSRRVRLTPLGDELLRDITPAVQRIDRAVVSARATAQGLRIGFRGPFASSLDAAIGESRSRRTEFAVTMVQLPWTDLFGALRRGELDMQVSQRPVLPDDPELPDDLVAGPIVGRYRRVAAIARDHPLAARSELTTADLVDVPVLRFATDVRTESEMLSTVAQGGTAYLTSTAMAAHFAHPRVIYIPLCGMPPAEAMLLWHKDCRSAKVRAFAEIARTALPAEPPGARP